MALHPKPGIMEIAAYVGGEASIPGVDQVLRLASNENPLGPSPRAAEAYRELSAELHRYPDGGATTLRDAIAETYGLDGARIVCGAGSDELISLLTRAYAGPGDEVLYSRHGFLMYPISAKGVGARPVAVPERNLQADVDALLAAVTEDTRILFLANPNNPTGSYLPESEIERLQAGLPESVLLVIDAAYAEYVEAADYEAGVRLVEKHDNVVMTRTFSKIHGLAALRLGWAYCPPAVADVLNRLRGPFNVSAPALAAGEAAIRDQDYVARCREDNSKVRAAFIEGLKRLNLRAEPSEGNFVLVRFSDAAAAAEHLKRKGILVRRMDSYGLAEHLRITIGTAADMDRVLQALSSFDQ